MAEVKTTVGQRLYVNGDPGGIRDEYDGILSFREDTGARVWLTVLCAWRLKVKKESGLGLDFATFAAAGPERQAASALCPHHPRPDLTCKRHFNYWSEADSRRFFSCVSIHDSRSAYEVSILGSSDLRRFKGQRRFQLIPTEYIQFDRGLFVQKLSWWIKLRQCHADQVTTYVIQSRPSDCVP